MQPRALYIVRNRISGSFTLENFHTGSIKSLTAEPKAITNTSEAKYMQPDKRVCISSVDCFSCSKCSLESRTAKQRLITHARLARRNRRISRVGRSLACTFQVRDNRCAFIQSKRRSREKERARVTLYIRDGQVSN